jgi:hypothetical protein
MRKSLSVLLMAAFMVVMSAAPALAAKGARIGPDPQSLCHPQDNSKTLTRTARLMP